MGTYDPWPDSDHDCSACGHFPQHEPGECTAQYLEDGRLVNSIISVCSCEVVEP